MVTAWLGLGPDPGHLRGPPWRRCCLPLSTGTAPNAADLALSALRIQARITLRERASGLGATRSASLAAVHAGSAGLSAVRKKVNVSRASASTRAGLSSGISAAS